MDSVTSVFSNVNGGVPDAVVVEDVEEKDDDATSGFPSATTVLKSNVAETSTESSYPPLTNDSLRAAVSLWFSDQRKAESKYGPI